MGRQRLFGGWKHQLYQLKCLFTSSVILSDSMEKSYLPSFGKLCQVLLALCWWWWAWCPWKSSSRCPLFFLFFFFNVICSCCLGVGKQWLLTVARALLILCKLAELFATSDLQRNLSSGIVLTQGFSRSYCKSTAGQAMQNPGCLVLLPKAMPLEKLREAISAKWKRTVGMCKMRLNSE